MSKWLDIKDFPTDGKRCLIKLSNGNITIGFWGKCSHVPLYGIIDESFCDPNDIDFCDSPRYFIELNKLEYILSDFLNINNK